ncbi:PulJ/GspJ family protein [Silvimonas iriomotensis]|uniref:Prepilin-type N-terminal cleavage/methylation domain-containing protein n=1 Tax=Silvimonas iriomotensis TaxID=449662 RepID=A0ABQ2P8Q4_9NEIS|nr:hypothetical protein [Silvimonas iriomotensis]GGP20476.1 hypothetical protein GCM10010970_15400 [Silvimonas iriomotensis]
MRSRSIDRPWRQRGATLFEGLIAMLLVAIVGVGLTYILSRSALSQTTLNVQNTVINQVRTQLMQSGGGMRGLCGVTSPTPIPVTLSASAVSVSTSFSCSVIQGSVTVGSSTQPVFIPSLNTATTDNAGLLGGSLTLGNGS